MCRAHGAESNALLRLAEARCQGESRRAELAEAEGARLSTAVAVMQRNFAARGSVPGSHGLGNDTDSAFDFQGTVLLCYRLLL